jgi:hypothetical protein
MDDSGNLGDVTFERSPASIFLRSILFSPYGFTRSRKRKPHVQAPPNILSIERLYQYNVLYTRAQHLKYCTEMNSPDFTDHGVTSNIQNDLDQHCEFSEP